MLFFVTVLTATGEYLLIANTAGLVDGGRPGLFWTLFGMTFVTLSLAQMSSMALTSGGQYHWVSEFAPAKYQELLSKQKRLCRTRLAAIPQYLWRTAACPSPKSDDVSLCRTLHNHSRNILDFGTYGLSERGLWANFRRH
jgi:hypothetical protein